MAFKELVGDKLIYACDACGTPFQMGQGRYEGTFLGEIGVHACPACGPDNKSAGARAQALARLRHLARPG